MSRNGEGLLDMESVSKSKPNWLLRGLIGISIGMHFVIFMHVSGLYRSHLFTRIELTLEDTSEPRQRSIPRPKHRPKAPELPQEVKRLVVKRNPIPDFRPMKIEPAENHLPDTLVEPISRTEIPKVTGLTLSDWQPGELTSDYETSDNYMEMIRLRIERFKRYPHPAKARHMEGMTTLRFAITREGKLKGLELIKSSRHRILDKAALGAVYDAAPFPPPPDSISSGDLTLEITIVFELT